MSHFSVDTFLYHPTEGKKLFPQGEQDPGLAWSKYPPGEEPTNELTAKGAQAIATALDAKAVAEDAVNAIQAQLDGQAAAHAADVSAKDDAHAAELAAKDAEIARLTAETETAVGQRDAAEERTRLAGLEMDRLKGDIIELQAQVAKFDHDGDGHVGGAPPKNKGGRPPKVKAS